MSVKNEMARNLLGQEPGRKNRHETATSTKTIAQSKGLQTRFLMRIHGLTEAQAHALAALVWGEC